MRPSTELLLDGLKETNAVVGKVKGEFCVGGPIVRNTKTDSTTAWI